MTRRDIRRTGVDIFTINLIREKIEVVFLHEVTNLVHLTACIEITRRIVRVTYHDCTCTRIDKFLKLLYLRKRETLVYCRSNSTDLCSCRNGKSHVVGVCRLWNDNLVTRVKTSHKREQHSLRASACDDDIISRDLDVVFLVIAYKFFAI